MNKYEIDIPWETNEWEPIAFKYPEQVNDCWLDDHGAIVCWPHNLPKGPRLIVRRKVRKYDWSKTLDDVLVITKDGTLLPMMCHTMQPRQYGLAQCWQPNIHGKCPVDGEACIVRVRQCDGEDYEDLASNFNWDVDIVYRWQFIRLADGVEW